MRNDDPLTEKLNELGIPVETREASPIEQILASGLGGIAGTLLGSMLGFGTIGRALTSLAGSLTGHIIVTHQLKERPRPASDGPPSPSTWSDRR